MGIMAIALVSGAQSTEGQVNLTVRLTEIQSLIVNPSQANVLLEYNSKEKYAAGVSSTLDNHLTVYSTGGFEVKAKAAVSEITVNNKQLAVNTIKITAQSGSTDALAVGNGVDFKQATLANAHSDNSVIISSTKGAANQNVSVVYAGAGSNAYIGLTNPNQSVTDYTTVVTYTISPK